MLSKVLSLEFKKVMENLIISFDNIRIIFSGFVKKMFLAEVFVLIWSSLFTAFNWNYVPLELIGIGLSYLWFS